MARSDFLSRDLHLEKQDSKIPLSFTGILDGYYTVVDVNEVGYGAAEYQVRIGTAGENNENAQALETIKQMLQGKYNVKKIEFHSSHFSIEGRIPMRKKNYEEYVTQVIKETISTLIELDIPTGDFLNGHMDESVSLYHIDSVYMFLSDRSYQQIVDDVTSQNRPEKSIKAGLGGAFLGAMIGAVLWAIFLFLGIYSWFAALVGVYLAFKFYKKKNGLFSLAGVITVVGIIIVTLLIANYVLYALLVWATLEEFGLTFSMALFNLIPILKEGELLSAFILDMVLGVGTAALYGAFSTYSIYQKSKNDGVMRKV